jgi:hypothetical protein
MEVCRLAEQQYCRLRQTNEGSRRSSWKSAAGMSRNIIYTFSSEELLQIINQLSNCGTVFIEKGQPLV